jgi:hypothetical protein
MLRDLIFIPPGESKGKYVVLGWEKTKKPADALVVFDGTITIRKPAPHVVTDFPDQGGIWERNFTAMNGEYLLRRKMTAVEPKDFRVVLSGVPQTPCPDWGANPADPGMLDAFYRKQGWYGPLSLPSAASAS